MGLYVCVGMDMGWEIRGSYICVKYEMGNQGFSV